MIFLLTFLSSLCQYINKCSYSASVVIQGIYIQPILLLLLIYRCYFEKNIAIWQIWNSNCIKVLSYIFGYNFVSSLVLEIWKDINKILTSLLQYCGAKNNQFIDAVGFLMNKYCQCLFCCTRRSVAPCWVRS